MDEAGAPVALLRFEEASGAVAFADSSGNHNSAVCGAVADTCPKSGQSGVFGGALLFDGNDFVDVGEGANFNFDQLTFAAWARLEPFSATPQLVFLKGISSWRIEILKNTNRVRFAVHGIANTGDVVSAAGLNDGQWHHLAGVYDGNEASLYIDGQLEGTRTGVGPPPFELGPLRLGTVLKGQLDEVAIFDRALTAAEVADVYDGRFNPNDRIVAPGQILTYRATVENTHPVQRIDGHQVAQSRYHEPEIGEPAVVLHGEPDDRVVTFRNTFEESTTLTCRGSDTCPATGQDGRFHNAIRFDGVNDYLEMPTLGSSEQEHSNDMWLNVSALPPAGTRAYILDADSAEDGSLEIYVNDQGNMVYDVQGAPAGLHVSNFSWRNRLGTWHRFTFSYTSRHLDGSNAADLGSQGTQLHVDGNFNSVESFTTTNLGPGPDITVGPGRIGNSLDGNAPYNGLMDTISFFKDDEQSGWANYPALILNFDEIADYDGTIFFDTQRESDHLVCASPATCPARSPGGFAGHAIVFDGVNDYLPVHKGSGGLEDLTLSLRVRVDQLPPSGKLAYLYATNSAAGNALRVYIDETGLIVSKRGAGEVNPLTSDSHFQNSFSFSGNLGVWKNLHIRYFWRQVSGSHRYDAQMKVNNVLVGEKNYYSSSNKGNLRTQMGSGRLGNDMNGASPLSGAIDNLTLPSVGFYDFELPDSAGIAFVSDVTDGRAAFCDDFQSCPLVTEGGTFGHALSFDGVDDRLTLSDVEIARGDYTIAGSFKTTASGVQRLLTAAEPASGSERILVTINNGVVVVAQKRATGSLRSVSSGGGLNDGNWHHFAAVVTGLTLSLFIDGAHFGSATVDSEIVGPLDVTLGSDPVGGGSYYAGGLDELVLIPSAVDGSGVLTLMNSTYPALSIDDDFVTFTANGSESVI